MGLKVDTIQNPSSATVNLTLDTSGNVAVGNNMTVAGTSTFTGSLGNITAGTVTASGLVTGATGALYPIVRPAASQTASGSAVNFTAIPSWVNRITVQIAGLSYAAAGAGVMQIGTGGSLTTTGYTTTVSTLTASINVTTITNGFCNFSTGAAASSIVASYVLTNMGSNLWLSTGSGSRNGDSSLIYSWGYITLSGALDNLSLVATSSTFDAGTINILYE